jgi:hypothetical protein
MLPKVENPIPETIDLGTILGLAGAGGVLLLVVGTMLGLPDRQRDAWARWGTAAGFVAGLLIYFVLLFIQLL